MDPTVHAMCICLLAFIYGIGSVSFHSYSLDESSRLTLFLPLFVFMPTYPAGDVPRRDLTFIVHNYDSTLSAPSTWWWLDPETLKNAGPLSRSPQNPPLLHTHFT
jgi:hypothetical protein